MRALTLALLVLSVAAPAVAASSPQNGPKNRPYDVTHYKLDIRLRDEGAYENRATLTVKAKKPLAALELDSFGLDIKAVAVDGAKAEFTRKEDPSASTGVLTVKPAKALAPGKEVSVQIDYTGKASKIPDFGFYEMPPDEPGALPGYYTNLEPEGAQQVFPCNDDPADKATFEVFAVVDGRYQVLSNGKKTKDEAFTQEAQNLRRVQWVLDKPQSTYLFALAVSQFDSVPLTGDVSATLHVPKGKAELTFVAQDATPALLKFEAAYLGTPYPFDKYDQVGVPHFLNGGMENTGLVFLRDSALVLDHKNEMLTRPDIVSLIAHEMAHQWFGDLVTLKWWNDAWLNEGFATYMETKGANAYFENDWGTVHRAAELLARYFRTEQGPRAHPLQIKGVANVSDGLDPISYEKGGAVLDMLELFVGTPEFKGALKDYLKTYAYSNVTSQEFFASVAKSTKKDLKAFQESWLYKKGYPVITPSLSYSGGTATVTIAQRPVHADEKGPFVFKLKIVFHRESTPSFHEERVVLVDKPSVTVKFDLPAAPQWVNWNKELQSLAKVDTSAVSEESWIYGARSDPDPVWRLQSQLALLGELVNPDAKELVKPTDAALTTVLEALAKDPSPYVRHAVLDRLADSPHGKLPSDFGPVVLALAKRPENLPEDAIGAITVRASALALLGKIDDANGKAYLLAQIQKNDLDINFVSAVAMGVARIGDTPALAALRAAVRTSRERGYPYFRSTAAALGASVSGDAVAIMREVLKDSPGDNDVLRALWRKTSKNERLKATPELAELIRDVIIDGKGYSDELRVRLMRMLDHVKTPEAKASLSAMAEKGPSSRIQENARQTLAKNFPAAPVVPAKAVKPSKKK